jgi:hypothetical protein
MTTTVAFATTELEDHIALFSSELQTLDLGLASADAPAWFIHDDRGGQAPR